MKDSIDIVLPVYNESKNLEKRFINPILPIKQVLVLRYTIRQINLVL